MAWAKWTRLTGLLLVAATACGLAAGGAKASALLGEVGGAATVGPMVLHVAHKQQHWHWDGAWWRHGPWADHGIHGVVVNPPWPTRVFVPWGSERLRRCAMKHPSFDPATGTYFGRGGVRRICP